MTYPSEGKGDAMQRDLKYLQRRATQERQAAAMATSEHSRAIHGELATRYEEILSAYSARPAEKLGCIEAMDRR